MMLVASLCAYETGFGTLLAMIMLVLAAFVSAHTANLLA